ncbi:hypothetical protein TNCV_776271 [Trichonephila clavipes]|nr:hypothetical protein TNCV_776271 [Trichonephila clavipes]
METISNNGYFCYKIWTKSTKGYNTYGRLTHLTINVLRHREVTGEAISGQTVYRRIAEKALYAQRSDASVSLKPSQKRAHILRSQERGKIKSEAV